MEEDQLGKILIENGFLTKEQLEEAHKKQKERGDEKPLNEILVEEGYITERALNTVLDIQRHKLEMKEREKEDADIAAAQESGIDPIIMGAIKREIRQLRREIDDFKETYMDTVKRYVRTQIRRVKKK